MTAYRFEFGDPASFTDDQIAEIASFNNTLKAEVVPNDPPNPAEVAIAAARAMPTRYRCYSVRAFAGDGSIVGTTGGAIDPDHDEDPDLLWGSVDVLPDHRRHHIGSRLLAYLVAIALREGRERIVATTNDRVPAGAEFARVVGARPRQAQHWSHLVLGEVNRSMLEQWASQGPDRAPDYELITWDDVVPEEHLDAWVELLGVMNTAPRDDLQLNDVTTTREQVREGEARMAAVGAQEWVAVARRRSDGVFAGFHNVIWTSSEPNLVWVDSTGVVPEHRGHAIGKWLKAVMTLRVLDERREATEIRTSNADSNEAMLAINHEMGYRPFIASTTWELSIEDAIAWLVAGELEIPALS